MSHLPQTLVLLAKMISMVTSRSIMLREPKSYITINGEEKTSNINLIKF